MTVQSAGAGLAGAVTLSDAYHRDMQLVQRYAQQQAQDKVEELYQAFAYKHSIPVEQLKEKVKETMGKVMMKAETTKGDGAKTEAHVGPARKVPFAKRKGEAEALGMPGLPPDVLAFFGVQSSVPATPPLVVREYAAPRPGSTEAIGGYESDTILWQPVIALPADGKAKLNFTLGSAPGGYQVIVAGHTLDGRIGAVQGMIPIAPPAPAAPVAQPGPIPPEMP
jgi:hypothetical protein